jgi:hypothetical protein
VALGAGIALIGVVVTSGVNMAIKAIDNREAKKRERAAKLEELVQTLWEFDHWLGKKEDIYVRGGEGEVGISPLAKLAAISTVHFSDFSGPI